MNHREYLQRIGDPSRWSECDQRGRTILFDAIRYGNRIILQQMLQSDQPVDSPDKYGITPLMVACRGRLDIVHLLLEFGASVYCCDSLGDTPLHWAVTSFAQVETQTLKLPLSLGPVKSSKRTAMEGIVQSLLSVGANPECKNLSGKNPMELLLEHFPEFQSVLQQFKSWQEKKILQEYSNSMTPVINREVLRI